MSKSGTRISQGKKCEFKFGSGIRYPGKNHMWFSSRYANILMSGQ
jgi:hypothetical protein